MTRLDLAAAVSAVLTVIVAVAIHHVRADERRIRIGLCADELLLAAGHDLGEVRGQQEERAAWAVCEERTP